MLIDNDKDRNEVIRVLQKAKRIITRSWCKGSKAKDKHGNMANPTESNAYSWCLIGAIQKSLYPVGYFGVDTPTYHKAVNCVSSVINYRDLGWFNDDKETTHDDVISALTSTIEKLTQEGKQQCT